jgi:type II secretory pathway component HofQ
MTRRYALVLAPLVAGLTLAGCGGSSSPNSPGTPTAATDTTPPAAAATAPADTTTATAEVKANWTKFFNYRTPRVQQLALLESGDQLGPAVKFAAKLQAKQSLKQNVKVAKVAFTTPTQASVSYALYNGTTALLNAASGVAVLVDGTWKVSETTFCTLVQLGNASKPVPSCPG